MRLHDLKPSPGAHRNRKRLGRGNASGQGTTAGKGTKGEKARSGGLKSGFRGMSSRNARMPKRRGFSNPFKTQYQIVNVGQLEGLGAGTDVDVETLIRAGLVDRLDRPVKILGDGELTVALNVVDIKLSGSAREKIERVGGSVTERATAAAPAPEAPVEEPPAAPQTEEAPAAKPARTRKPKTAQPEAVVVVEPVAEIVTADALTGEPIVEEIDAVTVIEPADDTEPEE